MLSSSVTQADNRQYYDQPHRLVLIPFWIEQAFRRKNKDLADVIFYEHVREVATPYDIAAMTILAHMDVSNRMGLNFGDTVDLTDRWLRQTVTDSPAYKELMGTVIPVAESEDLLSDTYVRLFEEGAAHVESPETFKIVDLKDNHLGTIIYPGFFTGAQDRTLAYLDAFMQTQHARGHTLASIAQLPVFRRYLDLLSKKRLAS